MEFLANSPAKKQSKWPREEDEILIEPQRGGIEWENISKRIAGRSAISCWLHYQNYLEWRANWDDEKKNKLAWLYESYNFKPSPFPAPFFSYCFRLTP